MSSFALLGTADVIAMLIIGVFLVPMFLFPRRRGGQLLIAREFEVNPDGWPAVRIVAAYAGPIPWLLRLIGREPLSTLQVEQTMMICHFGGSLAKRTPPTELATIERAYPEYHKPGYHITALFPIGFLVLAAFMVGRLTLTGVAWACAAVALVNISAALDSTNSLIVEIQGRRKPIRLVFLALGKGQPSYEDLCAACDRINEVAIDARRRGQLFGRDPGHDGADDRRDVLDRKVGNLPRLGPHIVSE
jgi:hypothetical protein